MSKPRFDFWTTYQFFGSIRPDRVVKLGEAASLLGVEPEEVLSRVYKGIIGKWSTHPNGTMTENEKDVCFDRDWLIEPEPERPIRLTAAATAFPDVASVPDLPGATKEWDFVAELIETARLNTQRVEASKVADAKRGFVYILQANGFGSRYKIGISTNVKQRITQISGLVPGGVTTVAVVEVADRNYVERLLHVEFGRKRLNGEWFNLRASEVKQLTQRLNEVKETVGISVWG